MSSGSIVMILLAAVAIGISLVVVAMGLNIYSSFKQGDVGRALFGSSGCAGLVFYCSIIFGVAGQLVLGLQVFSLAYILCLIVLPYLLIFSVSLSDFLSPVKRLAARKLGRIYS